MNRSAKIAYTKPKNSPLLARVGKAVGVFAVSALLLATAARIPLGGGSAIAADVTTGKNLSMSDALRLDGMNGSHLDAMVARVDEQVLIEQERLARFDYTKPVPAAEAVADNYFDDAVFIGNSQMVGFSRLSDFDATYYCSVGLNVFGFSKDAVATDGNGATVTIPNALRTQTFSKVYLLFGVNELGYALDTFISTYEGIVAEIRQINPDARIYIESLLPMNEAKWSGYACVNNENVRIFNEAVQQMAARNEVYFVNIFEAFADETGALPADMTSDGVHLTAPAIASWSDYLRTHTTTKK